jgi:hypothetical protein
MKISSPVNILIPDLASLQTANTAQWNRIE